MLGFIIVIHVLVCMLLGLVILMQSGRGGGLTETFSGAESMFGAKTNSVLVKATSILAGIFIVTCLSLAFLSSKSNKSLISEDTAPETAKTQAVSAEPVVTTAAPAEQPQATGANAHLPEPQNQPPARPAETNPI